jgi:hypothetical protein
MYVACLDLHAWGYVKDRVEDSHVHHVAGLQARIHIVNARVNPDVFDKTWQEKEYRVVIICATNGPNVGVY